MEAFTIPKHFQIISCRRFKLFKNESVFCFLSETAHHLCAVHGEIEKSVIGWSENQRRLSSRPQNKHLCQSLRGPDPSTLVTNAWKIKVWWFLCNSMSGYMILSGAILFMQDFPRPYFKWYPCNRQCILLLSCLPTADSSSIHSSHGWKENSSCWRKNRHGTWKRSKERTNPNLPPTLTESAAAYPEK